MTDARAWMAALAATAGELKLDEKRFAKQRDKLRTEGGDILDDALGAMRGPDADNARQAYVRKHRTELQRERLAAFDGARWIAASLWGVTHGLLDDREVFPELHLKAFELQKIFASWEAFHDAFERGRVLVAGGMAKPKTYEVPAIAWKLDLGVAGKVALARYRRSKCGHCGGIKELPSKTAFVYCDFCGELCDYDFERYATEDPEGVKTEPPDPSIAKRLEKAQERGDRAAYRAIQHEQYTWYARVSANLLSPRIADDKYRAAWIDYMADAITAFVFDEEMTKLDTAYQMSVGETKHVEIKQKYRIIPSSFTPVVDAHEARLAHLEKLHLREGLFEKDPDRMTPTIWRQVQRAMFAHHWLPRIDEDSSRELLARLGLNAEFDAAPKGKRSKLPCHRCGDELEIVAGARRITCEHCGHRLELVAVRS